MRLLSLIMLTLPIVGFAQNSLDREVLLDSLKFVTQSSQSVYNRNIKNYYTIQNEYLVTDYYRSGQIEMTGKTTDRDDLVKKGIFYLLF